jgi:prepilin-type N-terminal cleavage/methylation domain-containing protein
MKKTQRGDTLIEVLIAITVLGIIVAGVLATMNRSLVSILNSAERTASRTDINTQIDLLNYIYRNDRTTWSNILNITHAGNISNGDAPNNAKEVCKLNEKSNYGTKKPGSFYIEPEYDTDGSIKNVRLQDNLTNSNKNGINEEQRARIGQGIWIDAVYYRQGPSNQRSYIDFYIKACWVPFGGGTSPGANTRSMTTTRIYDHTLDNSSSTVSTGRGSERAISKADGSMWCRNKGYGQLT